MEEWMKQTRKGTAKRTRIKRGKWNKRGIAKKGKGRKIMRMGWGMGRAGVQRGDGEGGGQP